MRTARCHVRDLWECWKGHVSYHRQVRELRRLSNHKRRQLWSEQLERAEAALDRNDSHAFYKVVKQLAPRQPRERVQLRDDHGAVLSVEAEQDAMLQHWTKVFDHRSIPVQGWVLSEALDVSWDEACQAMRKLSARKAVAPGCAPGAAWKYAPDEVVDCLQAYMQDVWSQGVIDLDPRLARAWLHFLTKAGRLCRKPGDLRPIALQPSAGKVLSIVLCARLQPHVDALAQAWPQFAYLQRRGTSEAITRVVAHCSAIRAQLKEQQRDIHARHAGVQVKPFVGGAQLSIDMSQAFNLIPRAEMWRALIWARVPEPLVQAIMQLHECSSYQLGRPGDEDTVPLLKLQRGARQWLERHQQDHPFPCYAVAAVCARAQCVLAELSTLQPRRHRSSGQPAQEGSQAPDGTQASHAAATLVELPSMQSVYECQECGQTFPTLHLLKTHEGKRHKLLAPVRHFDATDRASYSKEGLPICRFCDAKFTKWGSLQRHLKRNGCPALRRQADRSDDAPSVAAALPSVPSVPSAALCGVQDSSEPQPVLNAGAQPKTSIWHSMPQIETESPDQPVIQWANVLALPAPRRWTDLVAASSGLDRALARVQFVERAEAAQASAQASVLFGHLLPAASKLAEIADMDADLRNAKRPREIAKPKAPGPRKGNPQGGKGRGRGHRQWGRGGGQGRTSLEELVRLMAQVLLRQGDQLQRLSLDTGFFLILQTPPQPGSITNTMFRVTSAWKKMMKETPEKLDRPLRQNMIECLFLELAARAQLVRKPEAKAEAQQLGIINDKGDWNYRIWNATSQQLEVDQKRMPLKADTFLEQIDKATAIVRRPDVITRFQAIAPLSETTENASIPFLLDLSLREQELHNIMLEWCELAVFELLAGRLRRARLKRPAQLEKLQELLNAL
ncbi:Pol [Symbiodinium sp. CCMP2592]|nr:Pol [Symbiodinium sp. CCMP2592]